MLQSEARDSDADLPCAVADGAGRVTVIACWDHHFFQANCEQCGACFALLRPLFLDDELSSEDIVERTLRLIRKNTARAVARKSGIAHKFAKLVSCVFVLLGCVKSSSTSGA